MQTYLARVCANSETNRPIWNTGRMAQRDLVAAVRAHEVAETRLKKARTDLDEVIRNAVISGEWQIADVAKLTGWSRETIRKIAYPKD